MASGLFPTIMNNFNVYSNGTNKLMGTGNEVKLPDIQPATVDGDFAGASCPAWGTWIEIQRLSGSSDPPSSCPAWGTWIEIRNQRLRQLPTESCPAWGTWIEICSSAHRSYSPCRAPHGARGLKWKKSACHYLSPPSCPAWGTWIEIEQIYIEPIGNCVVPRMGHVD